MWDLSGGIPRRTSALHRASKSIPARVFMGALINRPNLQESRVTAQQHFVNRTPRSPDRPRADQLAPPATTPNWLCVADVAARGRGPAAGRLAFIVAVPEGAGGRRARCAPSRARRSTWSFGPATVGASPVQVGSPSCSAASASSYALCPQTSRSPLCPIGRPSFTEPCSPWSPGPRSRLSCR